MARIFRSTARAPRGSLQEQVEKATNELLSAPDWPTTMEICDVVNMDPSKARDVCKALKKRLQNKNPRVQWFTLTVVESMVKNCGEYLHTQVVESSILFEMVKIGKKKGGDLQVRDHCLGLLDTWHEAFGGERGRIGEYYDAYDELRRVGVIFPQRSATQSVPIFTPPATRGFQQQNAPLPSYSSPGYGTPGALQGGTEMDGGGMTMADLANARSSAEVLAEMLQASREGPADDVVTELVEQCQTNQSRVMALIDTTPDEELLRQGLALNDELQKVLAKYNGGAGEEAGEEGEEEEEVATIPPPPPTAEPAELARFDEEELEEGDDFGALAHRSTATEGLQQATQSAPPTPVAGAGVGPLEDLMGSNDLQSLLTAPNPPPPPPPQLPQPPQPLQPLYYQPPPPPQQYEMQPYQQQYQSPPQYPPPNIQYYQQPYQAPPPPYQSLQTASPGSNPLHSNPPSQFGPPPPPPQFAPAAAALNPFDDETAFSAIPEPPYAVDTGYVAPWAVAGGAAYAYGNQIEGGGAPPRSPQQQALLYGTPPPAPPPIQETSLQALSPPTLSYSPPALTAPPAGPYSAPDARRASYPLDASSSLAMAATLSLNGGRTPGAAARPAVSQSMAPAPSNQGLTPQQLAKNVDPMDTLFGDLVDMGRARGGLNAGSAPQGTSLAASKMGSA